MEKFLFIAFIILLPVFSSAQQFIKGTVYGTIEKKICDLNSKIKHKKIPGIIIIEKGTSNATLTLKKGEFSLTLTKNIFPDTIVLSGIGYITKEIIIKNKNDTSFLIDMSNYETIGCELISYSYTDLSLLTNSDIQYAPYSLGVLINLENPFSNTNLFTSYRYSTNLRQNTFKEFKIGINDYQYNISADYTRQNYFYENNNINLERNKINLTKNCNDVGIYSTFSYSYNKNNILNHSFSAYKYSLKKRIINIPNFTFYLKAGIEYYNQFSYQAGGNINFNFKKLHKLNFSTGVNYDTFMNYNFLNFFLHFNIMDIPYWPFRFTRY